METIVNKILSRIYGHGRGWSFTPKDFADCGERSTIDTTLTRLVKKGVIRKALRGVYDYPRFSKLFGAPVSPDPYAIAYAIARSFGWSISPSGETALNLLGLSTQVPAAHYFFSDGPTRTYAWSGGVLTFTKRAVKETSALTPKTAMIVQALKALGENNVTPETILQLRKQLSDKEIKTALREAQYVTGWVYLLIKKIAETEH